MNHIQREATGYNVEAPKKRLNVTVNEDLVRIAQIYTNNLSQTIEELLADFILKQRDAQRNDAEHWKKVHKSWNAFYEKHGHPFEEHIRDYLPEDEQR